MHASTVPEASKLPVIFLMIQRSARHRGESNPSCCSPRSGPAHRLTGCHNKPNSSSCLLEPNSGKATATATPLVTTLSRGIRWVLGKGSVLVQVLEKQGPKRSVTIHLNACSSTAQGSILRNSQSMKYHHCFPRAAFSFP